MASQCCPVAASPASCIPISSTVLVFVCVPSPASFSGTTRWGRTPRLRLAPGSQPRSAPAEAAGPRCETRGAAHDKKDRSTAHTSTKYPDALMLRGRAGRAVPLPINGLYTSCFCFFFLRQKMPDIRRREHASAGPRDAVCSSSTRCARLSDHGSRSYV